ncbi:unnamed protein product [Lymnaea stagnalis]|uniref:Small ribosomal subunit protein mS38 n=1 Tax=Lymnaea stagnalis TaxID=6523 RepID=A0AAV2H0V0_LYMST
MTLSRYGLHCLTWNACIPLSSTTVACRPFHSLPAQVNTSSDNTLKLCRADLTKDAFLHRHPVIPEMLKPLQHGGPLSHAALSPSIDLELIKNVSAVGNMEQEYRCPSRLLQKFSELVILDKVTSINSCYKCPVPTGMIDSMKAPNIIKSEILEGPGKSLPMKEAKIIMRIRHKKMKKHKLKKLRKRMYFLWKKQRLARVAKRMAIYHKELEEIEKEGNTFDPETFVREQLLKAKKGGYTINVFESKS